MAAALGLLATLMLQHTARRPISRRRAILFMRLGESPYLDFRAPKMPSTAREKNRRVNAQRYVAEQLNSFAKNFEMLRKMHWHGR